MKQVTNILSKVIFLFLGMLGTIAVVAQEDLEQLENQLDESYGIDKLVILNELTAHNLQLNIRRSLKYGKQAVDLSENLFDETENAPQEEEYFLKVDAYNLLGEAHFLKEHYYDAQLTFQSALKYAFEK